MKRLLVILAVLVAQAIPATAQSRDRSLDSWVDASLVPYVRQQLTTHPRFKGETVMFVILRDNSPAPHSDALSLSVRDRILAAAIDTPGVTVGWQQGRNQSLPATAGGRCAQSDVHYFIGVELTQSLNGEYAVEVRALDLEDKTWVTGFGKHWQGRLSTSERQAVRQQRNDETFLGAREVPFSLDQADLLAVHLARQLSCRLHRGGEDEYVVAAAIGDTGNDLGETIQLARNNLAGGRALRIAAANSDSNATLTGKAHRIDGDLHQYWLTLSPLDSSESLPTLSASAYVRLPAGDAPQLSVEPAIRPDENKPVRVAARRPGVVSVPNAGENALIDELRIDPPMSIAECRGPCSVLGTRARQDAIVFFLQHQAGHGLVRLSDRQCRVRSRAHVVRAGEAARVPISRTSNDRRDWQVANNWSLQSSADVYYAVVTRDADLARRLANLFDRLPLRCSDALRPGMQGDALQDWLSDFAGLAAQSSDRLDWRGIEVKELL